MYLKSPLNFSIPRLFSRKFLQVAVVLFVFLFSCHNKTSTAEESPYRSFYPDIQTISTGELRQQFQSVILIDIRNAFEFDVVHIASSINRPLADGDFTRKIQDLRGTGKKEQVVIVGNDSQSSRAFEAAKIARLHDYENISVYEAGVFAWLYAYPERTVLLGDSPADIEQTLPLVDHQIRLMPFPAFARMAGEPDVVVVDIRDIFHRRSIPGSMTVRNIPFDAFLVAIANRIWAENHLLIFDADGSRVRWLQIFLQAGGYYNFSFLDGGMDSLPAASLEVIGTGSQERISVNQMELQKTLRKLRDVDSADTVLMYIVSAIRYENLAFIDLAEITESLDISSGHLLNTLEKMFSRHLLHFKIMADTAICLVDPGLAWKGDRSGSRYQLSMRQFPHDGSE